MDQIIHILFLTITWALPVFLIVKWRMIGLAMAVVLVWITPLIWVEIISMVDLEYHPGVLYAAWLSVGWQPAIVYCVIIFGVVTIIKRVRGPKASINSRAHSAPRRRAGSSRNK